MITLFVLENSKDVPEIQMALLKNDRHYLIKQVIKKYIYENFVQGCVHF